MSTLSVQSCRWILRGYDKLIRWVRMSFKPTKSRSVVLKKGKVENKFKFTLAEAVISTPMEKPAKSLGKTFHCNLRDTEAISKANNNLVTWLSKIDRSGLPRQYKVWTFQHTVLLRILWLLLLYSCSTIMSINMCIYVYIYMDVCV